MRRSLAILGLCAALWSIAAVPSIAWAAQKWPAPPTDAVVMLAPPTAAPAEPFVGPDEDARSLADYADKTVVLNFWATWCAPCVRELPSLDRLAAKLPADRFAVLALSNDRAGFKKVKPFLADLGIEALEAQLDRKSALARKMGLRGLPTTFVIAPGGQVIAKLEGIAEWDSPEFVDWLERIKK